MNLKSLATKMLLENINLGNDEPLLVENVVGELLGGAHEYDLREVVDTFLNAGGEIKAKTNSWLGNMENQSISAEQIESTLSLEKIDQLASVLNLERREVSRHLAKMLPELIDMSSRSGNLVWARESEKPTVV